MTIAEEQTSIVDRKYYLQSEPSRESSCQNPEPLEGAEGEEQEAQQSPWRVPMWRKPKKIHAAGEGWMVKSMYFASRTVELVDQPPA